jgi:hypothetical protein
MGLRRLVQLFAFTSLLCCAAPLAWAGEGVREIVPDKYKARYQRWKSEFLATEMGRQQWESYRQNHNFTLTVTVSPKEKSGAGTGKYEWDDTGRLIAATITLGTQIDEGYPNPIYYPVMNSLAPQDSNSIISGNVLAATKLAHELGHVGHTAKIDGAVFRHQTQLMTAYNKILLANRHNTRDPRLLDLAQQMGGTPVQIWEDREYWGEVNAMRYLRDRITKESERRALFSRILRTVEFFAGNYIDRFDQVAQ